MSRRKNGTTPPYCLHSQSGRAYVRLSGKQIMLGEHGSPESRQLYHRVVAEWEANGRRLTAQEPRSRDYRIAELCAAYQDHCKVYYRRKDKTPTMEATMVQSAIKRLEALYADLPVSEFGVRQLKTVRESMIREGLARVYINTQVGRIVRMIRWGVEEELVPAEVFGRVRAVRRLQVGRSEARETEPRQPVSEADMKAVLPHLGRFVRGMVLAMWHTAMRCGEVVQLRTCDVEMNSDKNWVFKPLHHKKAHLGQPCIINIGPEAQAVLKEFVRLKKDAYWFQPEAAYKEHLRVREENRKAEPAEAHLRARERKRSRSPRRRPGVIYDTHAVRRAITRACKRAGIDPWTPHQLRHAALTRIREQRGIEASVAVGGHYSKVVTELYTHQARLALAAKVMAEIG